MKVFLAKGRIFAFEERNFKAEHSFGKQVCHSITLLPSKRKEIFRGKNLKALR